MTIRDAQGRPVYLSVDGRNEITLRIPNVAMIKLPRDQFQALVGLVTRAILANQKKEAK